MTSTTLLEPLPKQVQLNICADWVLPHARPQLGHLRGCTAVASASLHYAGKLAYFWKTCVLLGPTALAELVSIPLPEALPPLTA